MINTIYILLSPRPIARAHLSPCIESISDFRNYRSLSPRFIKQNKSTKIVDLCNFESESQYFEIDHDDTEDNFLLNEDDSNLLKEKVDENRFEQELVYYIEKFDITEEKVRLQNHLEYFIEALETPESNGKKLGFIAQEMGREINTIGSKANHAGLQKIVIQMKDELEKIKEQLLNVL